MPSAARLLSTTLLVATGLSYASPSKADVELRTGVDGRTSWNSNVLAEEDDEQDDLSFRTSPWFALEDDRGALQWDFSYRPAYEVFVDQQGLSGWDHNVRGGLEWRVRPDTTIRLDDRFVRFSSVTRFNESAGEEAASDPIFEAEGRLRRFKRNTLSAEIEHRLSAVRTLRLSAGHTSIDFSSDTVDRENASLTAGYQQRLSERNSVGGFVSWRRQSFDAVGDADERRTDYYNLSLSWVHQFDPTLRFEASAGPTLVDPQTIQAQGATRQEVSRYAAIEEEALQDPDGSPVVRSLIDIRTCPTLDDGTPFLGMGCQIFAQPRFLLIRPSADDFDTVELVLDEQPDQDDGVTFFADVSVMKTWERWAARVSYQRRDDSGGGAAFSALSDIVNGSLTWTPSQRWTLSLRATWLRQTQSSESVIPVVALRRDRVQGVAPVGGLLFNASGDAAEAFALRGIEVDNEFQQTQINLRLNARYRLTRRVSLFGDLFFLDVDRDRDVGEASGFDRYQLSLGISYEFDPIRL